MLTTGDDQHVDVGVLADQGIDQAQGVRPQVRGLDRAPASRSWS
ncbi:hypothetical protein [Pseudonocardia abyssalis]|nr:hypothetical protein [Pseudonocardia abyssalis]